MTTPFGTFDGLDNRKTLLALFKRLGGDRPEVEAGMLRAGFLQGLLTSSTNGFHSRPIFVTPCSPTQAYRLLVAITGCLGVPIEKAAKLLERVVLTLETPGAAQGCETPTRLERMVRRGSTHD